MQVLANLVHIVAFPGWGVLYWDAMGRGKENVLSSLVPRLSLVQAEGE